MRARCGLVRPYPRRLGDGHFVSARRCAGQRYQRGKPDACGYLRTSSPRHPLGDGNPRTGDRQRPGIPGSGGLDTVAPAHDGRACRNFGYAARRHRGRASPRLLPTAGRDTGARGSTTDLHLPARRSPQSAWGDTGRRPPIRQQPSTPLLASPPSATWHQSGCSATASAVWSTATTSRPGRRSPRPWSSTVRPN